ncbi:MAG: GDP-mannose 4,6-dehydratase [Fimbriimonadaceae bacterium]|nr:GDP-mannose 4,6-dehydratase [Fimbriimonadaceae bacterium]QYK56827.1 MAG: GDP-mannose 4,6-dehydratase [Fimbriimonadaceae bacterium]
MRVLVTGAAGFLGSHLVDRLLARGDEVVGLDNGSTGRWENLRPHANLRILEGDACDPLSVDGPLEGIVHMASPASPADFARMPLEILRANSIGTERCLQLAMERGARMVFASTSEVYGDPAVSPQAEAYWGNVNPVGPRSPYDESKRFGEAMAMAYHRLHGLSVGIARYFNTFGPRMRADDGRAVPTLIHQALRGEPLTIQGTGEQTRSFGYVDDTIEGTLLLLDSPLVGPVNIGSEEELTVLTLAKTILVATGSASEIVHVPAPQDDPRQRKPDLTRARRELGFEPRVSLEDGLSRTIEWMRESNGDRAQALA